MKKKTRRLTFWVACAAVVGTAATVRLLTKPTRGSLLDEGSQACAAAFQESRASLAAAPPPQSIRPQSLATLAKWTGDSEWLLSERGTPDEHAASFLDKCEILPFVEAEDPRTVEHFVCVQTSTHEVTVGVRRGGPEGDYRMVRTAYVWNVRLVRRSDGRALAGTTVEGFAPLRELMGWIGPAVADRTLLGTGSAVTALSFGPDGRTLAVTTERQAFLWDTASQTSRPIAPPPDDPNDTPSRVTIAPNGEVMLVEGRIDQLRSVATGAKLATLDGRHLTFTREPVPRTSSVLRVSFAFAPHSDLLAITDAKRVVVWDIRRIERRREFEAGAGIIALAAPARRNVVLTLAEDGTADLWDLASGSRLRSHRLTQLLRPGGLEPGLPVAMSDDGRFLAVAGRGLSLSNLETGEALLVPPTGVVVNAVSFSPTSTLAWSENGLNLWNVGTPHAFNLDAAIAAHKQVRRLMGHVGGVSAIAFSRDGRTVATGGWDGMLKLWDLASLR